MEDESENVGEWIDILNVLIDRADAGDVDAEGEALDLVPDAFRLHDYRLDGDRTVTTVECGSTAAENTPAALYRLLWLFGRQALHLRGEDDFLVDFSRMYKSESLFSVLSPRGHFAVDPQFYKYRLGFSLSAAPQYLVGQESPVTSGVLGMDNGVRSASTLLAAWWKLFLRLVNRRWEVYGGNEFRV